MAPRWCGNGSLVPAEIAESPIDAFYGPFYTAETLSEAAAALRNATALAAAQQATQVRQAFPLPCSSVTVHLWHPRGRRCRTL